MTSPPDEIDWEWRVEPIRKAALSLLEALADATDDSERKAAAGQLGEILGNAVERAYALQHVLEQIIEAQSDWAEVREALDATIAATPLPGETLGDGVGDH